uniref:Uncharacterized protein n=1 Tax=Chromera velia CCMP2878 TaxID=1169474 RepID=A0A0G4FP28_9ALVE|eukprot:Cvel_3567.t1-p1 / transcript=Cvel_3567.t1 / gene=Cvel_3567 / organism=Chromera_velia_CCMP2878 / gene_product=hypothetical protein / transcript_product=hypothetical protein / location=Cvel_scaffold146:11449-28777(-) / protein_length=5124 / sequence_SO=supercontig / SO=protein_coding / is_pseudo=false
MLFEDALETVWGQAAKDQTARSPDVPAADGDRDATPPCRSSELPEPTPSPVPSSPRLEVGSRETGITEKIGVVWRGGTPPQKDQREETEFCLQSSPSQPATDPPADALREGMEAEQSPDASLFLSPEGMVEDDAFEDCLELERVWGGGGTEAMSIVSRSVRECDNEKKEREDQIAATAASSGLLVSQMDSSFSSLLRASTPSRDPFFRSSTLGDDKGGRGPGERLDDEGNSSSGVERGGEERDAVPDLMESAWEQKASSVRDRQMMETGSCMAGSGRHEVQSAPSPCGTTPSPCPALSRPLSGGSRTALPPTDAREERRQGGGSGRGRVSKTLECPLPLAIFARGAFLLKQIEGPTRVVENRSKFDYRDLGKEHPLNLVGSREEVERCEGLLRRLWDFSFIGTLPWQIVSFFNDVPAENLSAIFGALEDKHDTRVVWEKRKGAGSRFGFWVFGTNRNNVKRAGEELKKGAEGSVLLNLPHSLHELLLEDSNRIRTSLLRIEGVVCVVLLPVDALTARHMAVLAPPTASQRVVERLEVVCRDRGITGKVWVLWRGGLETQTVEQRESPEMGGSTGNGGQAERKGAEAEGGGVQEEGFVADGERESVGSSMRTWELPCPLGLVFALRADSQSLLRAVEVAFRGRLRISFPSSERVEEVRKEAEKEREMNEKDGSVKEVGGMVEVAFRGLEEDYRKAREILEGVWKGRRRMALGIEFSYAVLFSLKVRAETRKSLRFLDISSLFKQLEERDGERREEARAVVGVMEYFSSGEGGKRQWEGLWHEGKRRPLPPAAFVFGVGEGASGEIDRTVKWLFSVMERPYLVQIPEGLGLTLHVQGETVSLLRENLSGVVLEVNRREPPGGPTLPLPDSWTQTETHTYSRVSIFGETESVKIFVSRLTALVSSSVAFRIPSQTKMRLLSPKEGSLGAETLQNASGAAVAFTRTEKNVPGMGWVMGPPKAVRTFLELLYRNYAVPEGMAVPHLEVCQGFGEFLRSSEGREKLKELERESACMVVISDKPTLSPQSLVCSPSVASTLFPPFENPQVSEDAEGGSVSSSTAPPLHLHVLGGWRPSQTMLCVGSLRRLLGEWEKGVMDDGRGGNAEGPDKRGEESKREHSMVGSALLSSASHRSLFQNARSGRRAQSDSFSDHFNSQTSLPHPGTSSSGDFVREDANGEVDCDSSCSFSLLPPHEGKVEVLERFNEGSAGFCVSKGVGSLKEGGEGGWGCREGGEEEDVGMDSVVPSEGGPSSQQAFEVERRDGFGGGDLEETEGEGVETRELPCPLELVFALQADSQSLLRAVEFAFRGRLRISLPPFEKVEEVRKQIEKEKVGAAEMTEMVEVTFKGSGEDCEKAKEMLEGVWKGRKRVILNHNFAYALLFSLKIKPQVGQSFRFLDVSSLFDQLGEMGRARTEEGQSAIAVMEYVSARLVDRKWEGLAHRADRKPIPAVIVFFGVGEGDSDAIETLGGWLGSVMERPYALEIPDGLRHTLHRQNQAVSSLREGLPHVVMETQKQCISGARKLPLPESWTEKGALGYSTVNIFGDAESVKTFVSRLTVLVSNGVAVRFSRTARTRVLLQDLRGLQKLEETSGAAVMLVLPKEKNLHSAGWVMGSSVSMCSFVYSLYREFTVRERDIVSHLEVPVGFGEFLRGPEGKEKLRKLEGETECMVVVSEEETPSPESLLICPSVASTLFPPSELRGGCSSSSSASSSSSCSAPAVPPSLHLHVFSGFFPSQSRQAVFCLKRLLSEWEGGATLDGGAQLGEVGQGEGNIGEGEREYSLPDNVLLSPESHHSLFQSVPSERGHTSSASDYFDAEASPPQPDTRPSVDLLREETDSNIERESLFPSPEGKVLENSREQVGEFQKDEEGEAKGQRVAEVGKGEEVETRELPCPLGLVLALQADSQSLLRAVEFAFRGRLRISLPPSERVEEIIKETGAGGSEKKGIAGEVAKMVEVTLRGAGGDCAKAKEMLEGVWRGRTGEVLTNDFANSLLYCRQVKPGGRKLSVRFVDVSSLIVCQKEDEALKGRGGESVVAIMEFSPGGEVMRAWERLGVGGGKRLKPAHVIFVGVGDGAPNTINRSVQRLLRMMKQIELLEVPEDLQRAVYRQPACIRLLWDGISGAVLSPYGADISSGGTKSRILLPDQWIDVTRDSSSKHISIFGDNAESVGVVVSRLMDVARHAVAIRLTPQARVRSLSQTFSLGIDRVEKLSGAALVIPSARKRCLHSIGLAMGSPDAVRALVENFYREFTVAEKDAVSHLKVPEGFCEFLRSPEGKEKLRKLEGETQCMVVVSDKETPSAECLVCSPSVVSRLFPRSEPWRSSEDAEGNGASSSSSSSSSSSAAPSLYLQVFGGWDPSRQERVVFGLQSLLKEWQNSRTMSGRVGATGRAQGEEKVVDETFDVPLLPSPHVSVVEGEGVDESGRGGMAEVHSPEKRASAAQARVPGGDPARWEEEGEAEEMGRQELPCPLELVFALQADSQSLLRAVEFAFRGRLRISLPPSERVDKAGKDEGTERAQRKGKRKTGEVGAMVEVILRGSSEDCRQAREMLEGIWKGRQTAELKHDFAFALLHRLNNRSEKGAGPFLRFLDISSLLMTPEEREHIQATQSVSAVALMEYVAVEEPTRKRESLCKASNGCIIPASVSMLGVGDGASGAVKRWLEWMCFVMKTPRCLTVPISLFGALSRHCGVFSSWLDDIQGVCISPNCPDGHSRTGATRISLPDRWAETVSESREVRIFGDPEHVQTVEFRLSALVSNAVAVRLTVVARCRLLTDHARSLGKLEEASGASMAVESPPQSRGSLHSAGWVMGSPEAVRRCVESIHKRLYLEHRFGVSHLEVPRGFGEFLGGSEGRQRLQKVEEDSHCMVVVSDQETLSAESLVCSPSVASRLFPPSEPPGDSGEREGSVMSPSAVSVHLHVCGGYVAGQQKQALSGLKKLLRDWEGGVGNGQSVGLRNEPERGAECSLLRSPVPSVKSQNSLFHSVHTHREEHFGAVSEACNLEAPAAHSHRNWHHKAVRESEDGQFGDGKNSEPSLLPSPQASVFQEAVDSSGVCGEEVGQLEEDPREGDGEGQEAQAGRVGAEMGAPCSTLTPPTEMPSFSSSHSGSHPKDGSPTSSLSVVEGVGGKAEAERGSGEAAGQNLETRELPCPLGLVFALQAGSQSLLRAVEFAFRGRLRISLPPFERVEEVRKAAETEKNEKNATGGERGGMVEVILRGSGEDCEKANEMLKGVWKERRKLELNHDFAFALLYSFRVKPEANQCFCFLDITTMIATPEMNGVRRGDGKSVVALMEYVSVGEPKRMWEGLRHDAKKTPTPAVVVLMGVGDGGSVAIDRVVKWFWGVMERPRHLKVPDCMRTSLHRHGEAIFSLRNGLPGVVLSTHSKTMEDSPSLPLPEWWSAVESSPLRMFGDSESVSTFVSRLTAFVSSSVSVRFSCRARIRIFSLKGPVFGMERLEEVSGAAVSLPSAGHSVLHTLGWVMGPPEAVRTFVEHLYRDYTVQEGELISHLEVPRGFGEFLRSSEGKEKLRELETETECMVVVSERETPSAECLVCSPSVALRLFPPFGGPQVSEEAERRSVSSSAAPPLHLHVFGGRLPSHQKRTVFGLQKLQEEWDRGDFGGWFETEGAGENKENPKEPALQSGSFLSESRNIPVENACGQVERMIDTSPLEGCESLEQQPPVTSFALLPPFSVCRREKMGGDGWERPVEQIAGATAEFLWETRQGDLRFWAGGVKLSGAPHAAAAAKKFLLDEVLGDPPSGCASPLCVRWAQRGVTSLRIPTATCRALWGERGGHLLTFPEGTVHIGLGGVSENGREVVLWGNGEARLSAEKSIRSTAALKEEGAADSEEDMNSFCLSTKVMRHLFPEFGAFLAGRGQNPLVTSVKKMKETYEVAIHLVRMTDHVDLQDVPVCRCLYSLESGIVGGTEGIECVAEWEVRILGRMKQRSACEFRLRELLRLASLPPSPPRRRPSLSETSSPPAAAATDMDDSPSFRNTDRDRTLPYGSSVPFPLFGPADIPPRTVRALPGVPPFCDTDQTTDGGAGPSCRSGHFGTALSLRLAAEKEDGGKESPRAATTVHPKKEKTRRKGEGKTKEYAEKKAAKARAAPNPDDVTPAKWGFRWGPLHIDYKVGSGVQIPDPVKIIDDVEVPPVEDPKSVSGRAAGVSVCGMELQPEVSEGFISVSLRIPFTDLFCEDPHLRRTFNPPANAASPSMKRGVEEQFIAWLQKRAALFREVNLTASLLEWQPRRAGGAVCELTVEVPERAVSGSPHPAKVFWNIPVADGEDAGACGAAKISAVARRLEEHLGPEELIITPLASKVHAVLFFLAREERQGGEEGHAGALQELCVSSGVGVEFFSRTGDVQLWSTMKIWGPPKSRETFSDQLGRYLRRVVNSFECVRVGPWAFCYLVRSPSGRAALASAVKSVEESKEKGGELRVRANEHLCRLECFSTSLPSEVELRECGSDVSLATNGEMKKQEGGREAQRGILRHTVLQALQHAGGEEDARNGSDPPACVVCKTVFSEELRGSPDFEARQSVGPCRHPVCVDCLRLAVRSFTVRLLVPTIPPNPNERDLCSRSSEEEVREDARLFSFYPHREGEGGAGAGAGVCLACPLCNCAVSMQMLRSRLENEEFQRLLVCVLRWNVLGVGKGGARIKWRIKDKEDLTFGWRLGPCACLASSGCLVLINQCPRMRLPCPSSSSSSSSSSVSWARSSRAKGGGPEGEAKTRSLLPVPPQPCMQCERGGKQALPLNDFGAYTQEEEEETVGEETRPSPSSPPDSEEESDSEEEREEKHVERTPPKREGPWHQPLCAAVASRVLRLADRLVSMAAASLTSEEGPTVFKSPQSLSALPGRPARGRQSPAKLIVVSNPHLMKAIAAKPYHTNAATAAESRQDDEETAGHSRDQADSSEPHGSASSGTPMIPSVESGIASTGLYVLPEALWKFWRGLERVWLETTGLAPCSLLEVEDDVLMGLGVFLWHATRGCSGRAILEENFDPSRRGSRFGRGLLLGAGEYFGKTKDDVVQYSHSDAIYLVAFVLKGPHLEERENIGVVVRNPPNGHKMKHWQLGGHSERGGGQGSEISCQVSSDGGSRAHDNGVTSRPDSPPLSFCLPVLQVQTPSRN